MGPYYTSKLIREHGITVSLEDLQRIAWRRTMMRQQRGSYPEKYPEDPQTAFLMAGLQYFDREILRARLQELFTFKPFKTLSNGAFRIFRQRVPGRRYVIGADVASGISIGGSDAEGNMKTDFSAAVVLDLETGEEMAAYRAQVTPQEYAFDLSDMGEYYYDACIGVERNMDGGTVILTLAGECRYGNVFRFREWHRRTRQVVEYEGFPTTRKTRPVALNFLNQFVRDYPDLLWDIEFVREALVFVRDPKGVPKAAPGAHDDTVSARWIAHTVRRVQLGWLIPTEMKTEKYITSDRIAEENAA